MLPAIQKQCEKFLSAKIIATKQLSGGDINQAYKITTAQGQFFLKYNTASHAFAMFDTEAKGLELLAATKTAKIPDVIGVGETKEGSFLLLEYIDSSYRQSGFWENFGQSLAKLHQESRSEFGLHFDNFIGILPQTNRPKDNWTDYYVEARLQPQIEMGFNDKLLNTKDLNGLESIFKKIPEICPEEVPALIHGDLWSGNFMVGPKREVVLIDPSVSFSHREMDLAMTQLFGGFAPEFYQAYHHFFPIENGFDQRVEIYQLYYLLVHLNLFGTGYLQAVRNIVKRFS